MWHALDVPPKNPLGHTGRTVAANVARLRGRLPIAELARRLEAVGQRIPVLGLSQVEKGERRVDVDDLVALAMTLGVSPSTLLTPNAHADDDVIEVTAAGEVTASDLWSWLLVDAPIDLRVTYTEHSASADGAQMREFDLRAHPEFVLRRRDGDHPAREALLRLRSAVAVAVARVDARNLGGWTEEQYRKYWATQIRREIRALQDLADDFEAGLTTPEVPSWERGRGDD